jgi:hypothetical protein
VVPRASKGDFGNLRRPEIGGALGLFGMLADSHAAACRELVDLGGLTLKSWGHMSSLPLLLRVDAPGKESLYQILRVCCAV